MPTPQQYARRLHGSFRAAVHAAMRDAGMTRADLARELGIAPEKLSRALERPDQLTVAGIAQICCALRLDLTLDQRYRASDRQRLRNKRAG